MTISLSYKTYERNFFRLATFARGRASSSLTSSQTRTVV